MLYVSLPYLGLFITALVVVLLGKPMYERILGVVKMNIPASVITSLLLLVLIFIPVYLFFLVSVGQVVGVVESINDQLTDNPQSMLLWTDGAETYFPGIDLVSLAQKFVRSVSNFALEQIIPLTSSTVTFFMNLTFFTLFLVYMFPAVDSFLAYVKRILPLPKEDSNYLVDRLA